MGAGLILLPNTPLLRILVLSQVVNSFLLPVVLIFMLILVNRADLMGDWRNTTPRNIIAWGTVILVIVLTFVLLYLGVEALGVVGGQGGR